MVYNISMKKTDKKMTLEKLARMTQNGFSESKLDLNKLEIKMDKRFDEVENRLDHIENLLIHALEIRVEKLEDDMRTVKTALVKR